MQQIASLRVLLSVLFGVEVLTSAVPVARGAVALDALGAFLTSHGYGGAQLVHPNNFFRLPINSNGKAGDLTIDTGSPVTLLYRESLRKLGLAETKTDQAVTGAFGSGKEHFGTARNSIAYDGIAQS